MQFDLIVIGGGAAGFFGAIQVAEMNPGLKILILEKSNKLLSKVRVSGGGRCNVTHHEYNPFALARHYPRGEKQVKTLFKNYHAEHVVKWFASKGVSLKTEEDGRMFPTSDSSETIIRCFTGQAEKHNIEIKTSANVVRIAKALNSFEVWTADQTSYKSKTILAATGGSPSKQAYSWITELGHTLLGPIPSLFTFNDADKNFSDLMGVSVPLAEVRIEGTKLRQQGAVLITHWGLSGPAVIKLSAWAAQYLHERKYEFTVFVNWVNQTEEEVRSHLIELRSKRPKQNVLTESLFRLPQRLSRRLCSVAGIDEGKIWSDVSIKSVNKLVEMIIRCPFHIKGKTTFKEEFVTCGGIPLDEVSIATMESRKVANLFFAGEVLNIDGETGGFNFQSAWTTAFIAAKSIASSLYS